MEQPVSLDVFVAQAFDLGGIATLWWQSLNLLAFSQGRKARSLAYLVALLLMTVYITSFGTMLSAFTGYRVLSKPIVDIGIPLPGTLIPVNDFVPISAFIYDSDRIGLPANQPVQKYLYYTDDGGVRLHNAVKDYLVDTEYLVRTSRYDTKTNCTSEGTTWWGPYCTPSSTATCGMCKCRWGELEIRSYDYPDTLCLRKEPLSLQAAPTNERGFFQLVKHDQGILSYRAIPSDINSTFRLPNGTEIPLSAPTLDIGALLARPRYDGRGRLLAYKHPAPDRTAIYVDDYIASHTRCQTEDTYQWGFSVLGLLVFLCLSLVFAFLFWAVWADMKLNARVAASGRDLGTYRAVLDVAHVLERELGRKVEGMSGGAIEGELEGKRIAVVLNTKDLPESKLRRRRRNKQGGMADDDDTDIKDTVDGKEAYMTDIELMHLQTPPMHGNVMTTPPNDPKGQETEDAEHARGSLSGLRIM